MLLPSACTWSAQAKRRIQMLRLPSQSCDNVNKRLLKTGPVTHR